MYDVLVLTDGGNRGGTYGSFLMFDEKGNMIDYDVKYWGVGDHNQAEYWTVLFALDKVLKMGYNSVILWTDSETVVTQLSGQRPLHNRQLKAIRRAVQDRVSKLEHFQIKYVPRALIKSFLGH